MSIELKVVGGPDLLSEGFRFVNKAEVQAKISTLDIGRVTNQRTVIPHLL